MRHLLTVSPTPEQLSIISRNEPGVEVIRGAAGSGKTTTALLKLRALIGVYVNRRRRLRSDAPVRTLVLTFNRTLRGYIAALAHKQANEDNGLRLEVSTFASWARSHLRSPPIILDDSRRRSKLRRLGDSLALPPDFLVEEVEYLLGRFQPANLDDYVRAKREGRGIQPRVPASLRREILDTVVRPYIRWKRMERVMDWTDLSIALQERPISPPYDIIIVDEAQDFSANQLRAVGQQVANVHSLLFLVDTAQRIYARGFTWQEAGFSIGPQQSHRLTRNYRNTAEIAAFARPLVDGLELDVDATLPDFSQCERSGAMAKVLRGRYSGQVDHAIDVIQAAIPLEEESVAFLHPLGGGWFHYLRTRLGGASLRYVELTRESEWPEGPENIALSTLASAKGLEFDHVFILGLNAEVLSHDDQPEEDERSVRIRRLIAMGIGRAKQSVTIGYKPDDTPQVISYLEPATYEAIDV